VIRRTPAALVLLAVCAVGAQAQTTKSPAQTAKGQGQTTQTSEQQAKALNLSAYAELLRSDIRAQKVAIITEVMGFTEAEDNAFWPIYREYDLEMAKVGDERVALIADYAKNYAALNNEVADRLATKALELEARRQELKGQVYQKVKKALTPLTAARFLQVENQLLLLVDLQIAASLPIAPTVEGGKK
jgi:Spy/CpxP family protein refolding chaperone